MIEKNCSNCYNPKKESYDCLCSYEECDENYSGFMSQPPKHGKWLKHPKTIAQDYFEHKRELLAQQPSKYEQAQAKLKQRQAKQLVRLEAKEQARLAKLKQKEARRVARAEAKEQKRVEKERKAQLVETVEYLKQRDESQWSKNSVLLTDITTLRQQLSAQAERIAQQDRDLQEAKGRLAKRIDALGKPIDMDAIVAQLTQEGVGKKTITPAAPTPVEKKCMNCKFSMYNNHGKPCCDAFPEKNTKCNAWESEYNSFEPYVAPTPVVEKACANCKHGCEHANDCTQGYACLEEDDNDNFKYLHWELYVAPVVEESDPPVEKGCSTCAYSVRNTHYDSKGFSDCKKYRISLGLKNMSCGSVENYPQWKQYITPSPTPAPTPKEAITQEEYDKKSCDHCKFNQKVTGKPCFDRWRELGGSPRCWAFDDAYYIVQEEEPEVEEPKVVQEEPLKEPPCKTCQYGDGKNEMVWNQSGIRNTCKSQIGGLWFNCKVSTGFASYKPKEDVQRDLEQEVAADVEQQKTPTKCSRCQGTLLFSDSITTGKCRPCRHEESKSTAPDPTSAAAIAARVEMYENGKLRFDNVEDLYCHQCQKGPKYDCGDSECYRSVGLPHFTPKEVVSPPMDETSTDAIAARKKEYEANKDSDILEKRYCARCEMGPSYGNCEIPSGSFEDDETCCGYMNGLRKFIPKTAAPAPTTKIYKLGDTCTVCNSMTIGFDESLRTGICEDCRTKIATTPTTFTNRFGVALPVYCKGCDCIDTDNYECQINQEDSICRDEARAGYCDCRIENGKFVNT